MTSDREIVIARVFDAPRDLVFETFTDPKHVPSWWGPKGFTTTVHEMDVRPGGVWRHTMHGPDGVDYPNETVFIEVVKPERIVYSHSGGKQGDPDAQFQATWTFQEQDGKTKVSMQATPVKATPEAAYMLEGMNEGWNQQLDRLAELLPTL